MEEDWQHWSPESDISHGAQPPASTDEETEQILLSPCGILNSATLAGATEENLQIWNVAEREKKPKAWNISDELLRYPLKSFSSLWILQQTG